MPKSETIIFYGFSLPSKYKYSVSIRIAIQSRLLVKKFVVAKELTSEEATVILHKELTDLISSVESELARTKVNE